MHTAGLSHTGDRFGQSYTHCLHHQTVQVALLHGVKLVAAILILELVLDHMKDVPTCCVGGGILLAYDSILTTAKVVALHISTMLQGAWPTLSCP